MLKHLVPTASNHMVSKGNTALKNILSSTKIQNNSLPSPLLLTKHLIIKEQYQLEVVGCLEGVVINMNLM